MNSNTPFTDPHKDRSLSDSTPPASNPKRTYIVILNLNTAEDTLACLTSLFALQAANLSIVIVENGSRDGSAEYIQRFLARATDRVATVRITTETGELVQDWTGAGDVGISLVLCNTNLGFSGGNNVGIRTAAADAGGRDYYLWILNNDTIVTPNALTELLRVHSALRGRAIVGSALAYEADRRIVQSLGGRYNKWLGHITRVGDGEPLDGWQGNALASIDYPEGASILIDRAFVERVGHMAEEFFFYFEELDWVYRARRFGYRPVTALRSVVFHKVGKTMGTSTESRQRTAIADFYLQRNRLLFALKHEKLTLPMIAAITLLAALRRALRGHWSRARAGVNLIAALLTGRLASLRFAKDGSP